MPNFLQKLEQELVIQIPWIQEQKNQTIHQMEQELQKDQSKPGRHSYYYFQTNQLKARALECCQTLQMQGRVQIVQIHLT